MKKVCLLSISLFLSSLSVFAQREADPRWVFMMGLSGTDMSRSLVPNTGDPMIKPAFTFGFARNIELVPKMIGINVGLRYSPRGYWSEQRSPEREYTYGDNNTFRFADRTRSWNALHYLDIPLDVVLQVGGERTKFYASAGGYVGYGFYGKNKVRFNKVGFAADSSQAGFEPVQTYHRVNVDPFKESLKRLDYGINVSVGIRRNYTVLGLTYSQGLANVSNLARNGSVSNRSFGLFIKYYFDDAF
ncbi:hypothetical protein BWI93_07450 [Siphonobacter sp. BAB-5385]|uniref:outer membrane beta-barrel protein n=1 Tax=unclassified Siphonobacter TaxID=2635712 RepID=UPI000B9E7403|nr:MULTISPECIES: outer membrane beta-barrel protein [unclassified Siphonobacter]OZI08768.1 hypothetical protein BWI93_07450 [Siphonobacter sp. BAB-5385]PMD99394.1 hypothetical protein BWI97_00095 [Siphonobacter sp. BAB-5405]